MALLEVENLSKTFQLNRRLLSKDELLQANINISLKLEAGKTLAIVGETGSGKSTLARQLVGIEKPTLGTIRFRGESLDFNNKSQRQKRFKEIRMVFQNPYESINPQLRIGTTLDQVLKINTQLSKSQRTEKINQVLRLVGLPVEYKDRYPHMFSGGQRQRVAIARAIILEPSIIIADEPLSALDVSIQAQILNLLQNLQETLGISYIFISHDLNVVEHIADTVMVMYKGRVVEYGNVSQIFDEPLHPYTQALFASTPVYKNRFPNFLPQANKQESVKDEGCVFASRCQYCESGCLTKQPQLVTTGDDYQIACFRFE